MSNYILTFDKIGKDDVATAGGKGAKALFISVCRQGIFYIPLVLTLPRLMSQTGLYIVQPLADILSFFVAVYIVYKNRVR